MYFTRWCSSYYICVYVWDPDNVCIQVKCGSLQFLHYGWLSHDVRILLLSRSLYLYQLRILSQQLFISTIYSYHTFKLVYML